MSYPVKDTTPIVIVSNCNLRIGMLLGVMSLHLNYWQCKLRTVSSRYAVTISEGW